MRQNKNKLMTANYLFLSSDPFCVRLPSCLLCVVLSLVSVFTGWPCIYWCPCLQDDPVSTSVRVYRMTLYLLVSVFTGWPCTAAPGLVSSRPLVRAMRRPEPQLSRRYSAPQHPAPHCTAYTGTDEELQHLVIYYLDKYYQELLRFSEN